MFKFDVGFIGGGNMGSAIAEVLVNSKAVDAQKILICDQDEQKLNIFASKNFATTKEIDDVVKNCKIAFVAVKPQSFDSLKEKFGQNVKSEAIISIMAGKKLGFVKEVVANDGCSIVRIMPNLACRYGEGVTLAQLTDIEGELKDYVKNLLEKLGVLIEVEEKDFNFCSSVSGCGPAFFFEYFKYFYNQCIEYGLNEQDAKNMVLQTACGSAKLAMNSTESFEKLISNVCSKGGSTIEGVKIIESSDMEHIVKQTLAASTKRNKELEQV